MPPVPKYRSEPWLQSPLRTPVGEIELAGLLRNVPGIDPTGMRILRRFTLVLMIEGRGYYRDARGTKLELGPGDVVLVFPEIAHAYGPMPGSEWTQVYFVFDGPQFQLWRAQGLLAELRLGRRLGRRRIARHGLLHCAGERGGGAAGRRRRVARRKLRQQRGEQLACSACGSNHGGLRKDIR